MKAPLQTPLLALRKKRRVNLLKLAQASGISESHLSRIERGLHSASPQVAVKIVKFFNGAITRDQILFPEDYAAKSSKRLRKAS